MHNKMKEKENEWKPASAANMWNFLAVKLNEIEYEGKDVGVWDDSLIKGCFEGRNDRFNFRKKKL